MKEKLIASNTMNGSTGTQAKMTFTLFFSIVQISVGVFLMGYNTSLFNVPEKIIRENATEKHELNDFEWEIVNAMFPFGAGIGALFTGGLADRYGRRNFLLFNSIICIIGSLITSFSFSFIQLLIGRFITGITSGGATGISSIYLNEISPIHLRGVIGTSTQLVITLAIVISELLGYFWTLNNWYWRIGCIIPSILSIIQLIISYFTLPHSPQWLITHNRKQSAITNLANLRNSTRELAEYELNELLPSIPETIDENVNESSFDKNMNDMTSMGAADRMDDSIQDLGASPMSNNNNNSSMSSNNRNNSQKDGLLSNSNNNQYNNNDNGNNGGNSTTFDPNIGLKEAITRYPVIKKVFFISIFVHMLQQLSGINVVFYYSTTILSSVGVSNSYLGSVLIATANFFSVILATYLIDRKGRRILFLISCLGMTIAAILLTLMFIGINTNGSDIYEIGAILCLIFYVVAFEIGLGPIPWLFVAEITPIEYRGSMTSVSQTTNYAFNTLIALTSTSVIGALGNFGFLPFGVICFVGFIIVYKFVPETKQKSVKQILNDL